MCHSLLGRLFCTALLCLLAIPGPAAKAQTAAGIEQTLANSLTSVPTENLGVSGAFYVPAYSSVSMSQGKMVESYLKAPIALKPFSTVEVFVPTTDVRGGTGANFVVDWAATGEIAEPVVEALMLGGLGSGHYAFISQGRPIKVVGKN